MNRAYRRKLKRILETFDVAAAQRLQAENGNAPKPHGVAVVGLHKARAEADFIAEPLREESRRWLIERGFEPGVGPAGQTVH